MATTATQEGRNLLIRVENIDEPFVIRPLGGNAGRQITDTYLRGAVQDATAQEITDALVIALDGASLDAETGVWVPLPLEQRTNSERMGRELRLEETDQVAMAAFFWQGILGIAGVNLFLSEGGVAGHTKALWALVQRLGLSPQRTSPSSALETLMQLQGSTPTTSTRPDGAKPAKQPQDRRKKKHKG